MHKPALFLAVATLASCDRRPSFDEPFVDRSGGQLPEVVAPKIGESEITLDGKLDEPVWSRAASTGMFVSPSTGKAVVGSRVNARGRLAWSDSRLFVGIVVWDAAASSPFSRDEVDPHIWAKASGVELMLQPGDRGDNRDYFEVQVDAAGAVWDTRFDDYNQPVTGGPDDAAKRFGHQEWRSQIERVVRAEGGRYQLELAIPFQALAVANAPAKPRPGDVWRMNLFSFRDGQGDALAWSPVLGQGNFHRARRFGRLRFGP
ncbi:MAG: carbohydrate-binding family 9-like protein [Myxococcales bacterium]|nr:carbohydrate-binding family 9-like protein [Myxococcales bacterium]